MQPNTLPGWETNDKVYVKNIIKKILVGSKKSFRIHSTGKKNYETCAAELDNEMLQGSPKKHFLF
jgi:hypothetical protein